MASLIGCMDIIYALSCYALALTRCQTRFYCQFLLVILLFCLNMALSIFYLKRNPQNGKYWFKGELEKCMTAIFLPASIWGHITGTSSAFVKKPYRVLHSSRKGLEAIGYLPTSFWLNWVFQILNWVFKVFVLGIHLKANKQWNRTVFLLIFCLLSVSLSESTLAILVYLRSLFPTYFENPTYLSSFLLFIEPPTQY